ncbi:MAG: ribosome small subunit-dependent GTPase A [Nannocystaceae bacterium]|nr:ribosome small subunit-dependent GTPase A [Nannocystaceae bacterium]
MITSDLRALGWDDAWAQSLAESPLAGSAVGRVARMETQVATLWGAGEPTIAQLPTRLKGPDDRPAVGDWIAFSPGRPTAKVKDILQRRTLFERRAAGRKTQRQVVAANVDVVFVVSGLDGDFNPRRIERYLAAVAHSGAQAVVLLTKAATLSEAEREKVSVQAHAVSGGAAVHLIDVIDGLDADAAAPYLGVGTSAALVGSSGVGKSTLLNHWAGEARQETREVRARDGRGQHTTTHRELFVLGGGALVIDTPGMRELALWADTNALGGAFPDIVALSGSCKFGDCRHGVEPGCAVLEALELGSLDAARFGSFVSLRAEVEATSDEVHAQRRRANAGKQKAPRRSGSWSGRR